MQRETISHDHKLFSRLTEILVMQGTGRHSYGTDIANLGVLAVVMTQQGDTNKHGGKLTANALKQVIYRLRHGDGLDDLAPDWSEFDGPEALHRQASNVINLKSDFILQ
jgi:hypothetical protein